MKSFALAAGLLFTAAPAFAAAITPADASKHVGEAAIIEGVVADVHVARSGMILLDLGGRDPDNKFVALIFSKDAAAFSSPNRYIGQLVQISGWVQLYHGKPEITLTHEGQIQVITAAHSQKLSS
jgi:DNA/RNA endonuclease YhcR with UshA esterase domain